MLPTRNPGDPVNRSGAPPAAESSAAKSVIETALEPLVEFEIDTSELEEHAEEIRSQMNQIAQQYKQVAEDQEAEPQLRGVFQ